MSKPKTYLGDSVYAEELEYGVRLTTENGLPSDPSNTIFLEPEVLEALIQYTKRNPPYEWCHGSPTREDCARRGYCNRDPNCGE